MVWLFAFSCLIVFVGILLWCGIVNQIERRQRYELEARQLDMKRAKQDHKQWKEMKELEEDR